MNLQLKRWCTTSSPSVLMKFIMSFNSTGKVVEAFECRSKTTLGGKCSKTGDHCYLGQECASQEDACGIGSDCDRCTCRYYMGSTLNEQKTGCTPSAVTWYFVTFSILALTAFIVLLLRSLVAARLVLAKREATAANTKSRSSGAGVPAIVTTVSCTGYCLSVIVVIIGEVLSIAQLDDCYWPDLRFIGWGVMMLFLAMTQLSIALVWIDLVSAATKMQRARFKKSVIVSFGFAYAGAFVTCSFINQSFINMVTSVYAIGMGAVYGIWSKQLAKLLGGQSKGTSQSEKGATGSKGASNAMKPKGAGEDAGDRIRTAGLRMCATSVIYVLSLVLMITSQILPAKSTASMLLGATFYLILYFIFGVHAHTIAWYVAAGKLDGLSGHPQWQAVGVTCGLGKTQQDSFYGLGNMLYKISSSSRSKVIPIAEKDHTKQRGEDANVQPAVNTKAPKAREITVAAACRNNDGNNPSSIITPSCTPTTLAV